MAAAPGAPWMAPALLVLSAAAAADGTTVSFQQDVVPILNKHCVQCHMVGTELGNFSLYPDPRGNMVDMQSTQSHQMLVAPGKPDESYVFVKMIDKQASVGGKGLRMPWEYDLSPADIEVVRQWILQGAADN
jgi:hypothetical protein